MDGVYTVCEDWGEGSGLLIWETECNESDPGENKNLHIVSVYLRLTHNQSYCISDPPFVDTNVLIARPVKSNHEDFSFASINLTFLLVIIVLSILCLNVLIIGITVIICR